MKHTALKLFLSVMAIFLAVTCSAQFRRTSDLAIYPYTNTLKGSDVFIIGVVGQTNKNFASSNMLAAIGGINSQTASNIANYAAYLATNNFPVGGGGTNATGSTNEIFSYILSNSVAIGDTFVALDRAAAFPRGAAGRLYIGWGSTNMELRAVNGITNEYVSFNAPLQYDHAIWDRVVWSDMGNSFPASSKIIPASNIDSGWPLLQLVEESGNAGVPIKGASASPWTQLPIVAPNSTTLEDMTINVKSGFPLGNTNVYLWQGRQGGRNAFTASSGTDTITVPAGWGPPGSASNATVVFYDLGLGTMPQPLSNGVPYFVVTYTPTTLTVKSNLSASAIINLTTSGSGVMASEAGSLGKDYFRSVYMNGGAQPGINGLWASVQQQSRFSDLRLDNFKGTALRLTGQQAVIDNLEIIGAGIGIDLRKGPLDNIGMQFAFVTGLNIEQTTNSVILGGANNFFHGVHIESGQSTTAPVIDGSMELSDVVFDGLTYGGSPVLPNTNTLFQMGTPGGFAASYDLRHIYMSAAMFDSIQLVLNDQYRGQRIYAYNSTNGPQRYVGRLFAPPIPDSPAYSSMFMGETWFSQAGRFMTGPQQHQHEPLLVFQAGTNDTGALIQTRNYLGQPRSGFGPNGDLVAPAVVIWSSATNGINLSYPFTASTYVMTSDASITGIIGDVAGYPSSGTLGLTNSTGSNCNFRVVSTIVSYGGQITNNVLLVPSGKKAMIAVQFDTGTNWAATIQP